MKLLIVDDHEIVRKGVMATLGCDAELKDILEAATMEEAMKVITINQPDIVIVDVNLAGKNGIDLIEQAKNRGMTQKFVVFTSSSRKGDFERAKSLDVDGYILKDSNIEDMIYAIKSIGRGRKFYDAQITEEISSGERAKVLGALTEREREIFMEIGRGLSNIQIAEKLYISENTVKKHITSLLAKLGVSRRTEVALYATKLWRRKNDL